MSAAGARRRGGMRAARRGAKSAGRSNWRAAKAVERAMAAIAVVFMVLCPLAFRIVRVDFVSPKIINASNADTGPYYDAYTYISMAIIYAATAALAALFCARAAMQPRHAPAPAAKATALSRTRALALARACARAIASHAPELALAALCASLLASFFASPFKAVALHGVATMQDGTLAHICYAILFFVGWKILSRHKRPIIFAIPVCAVGAVNALLSLLAFYRVDTIGFAPIRSILGLPPGARVAESQALFSTFGNVNYLSGFGGVLFALAFAWLLFAQGELASPAMSAASAASASSATPSASAASAASVAPSALTASAAPIASAASAAPSASASSAASAASRPAWLGVAGRLAMVAVAFSIIASSLSSSGFFTALAAAPAIAAVALAMRFSWRRVALAAAALAVCAAVLAPLAARNPMALEETVGMFRSLRQMPVPAGQAGAAAGLPRVTLPEIPAASIGPGSGRLYIWKETFELIKARPLFGYGMDTLTYSFPQFDLGMVSAMGQYQVIVTKPHNIFISYLYGAGIPALLAFFSLVALSLSRFALCLVRRRRLGLPLPAATACFMAVWAAYLVQGFVNDDLVSTAPLWWIIGGVAFGLSGVPKKNKAAEAAGANSASSPDMSATGPKGAHAAISPGARTALLPAAPATAAPATAATDASATAAAAAAATATAAVSAAAAAARPRAPPPKLKLINAN